MVCRNQLRIALRLTTIALLVGACAAGYLLLRAEAFVKTRVITAIESAVPHWDMRLDDVRLDGAQARVFGLKIRPAGTSDDIIEIPELIVSLDPIALADGRSIVPESIQVRQPTIHLVRRADGSLNIDDLKPWPESKTGGTPLAELQRATVFVEQAGQTAQLRDLDVLLTPEAKGQYGVRGSGRLDEFGEVQVAGSVNIPRGDLDIKLGGRLRVDDRLIETAAAWHPTVGEKIAAWSKSGVRLAAAAGDDSIRGVAGPASLGLSAETDLIVTLKKTAGTPIEWSAVTEIVRGELDNPMFPLPLRNLSGRIAISADGIRIGKLAAANGSSGFEVVGGARVLPNGGTQKVFKIRAEDVSLDGPLQRFLTPGLATVHRLLNPHGRVDILANIDESGERVTQWNLESLVIRDGSFSCAQFPYPITEVSGKASQDGPDVKLEFSGKAGTREVEIKGRVIDAGPGAGFDILISSDGVPIDTQLKEAFNTPALKKVRQAAEMLHLTGKLDGLVRVMRAPNALPGTRPQYEVDVALEDGTVSYDGFPYRMENASGTIQFYETKDSVWHFKNVLANRGAARVAAEGEFYPPRRVDGDKDLFDKQTDPSPGLLDMTFQAADVPFDRDLYTAITTAAPDLKAVFDELNPGGDIEARDIRLQWVPGRKPEIALPRLRLTEGRVELKSFPYTWSDVDVTLRRDGESRVVIENLSAKHQDGMLTLNRARGDDGPGTRQVSYAESMPDGWRVWLFGLQLRDLVIDQDLLKALPESAAETLRVLDVRRPVNVSGDLKVESSQKWPFAIGGRGEIELPGNDATAGVELEGVRGVLRFDPIVATGETIRMNGKIDIQQMRAFNMALTNVRGPINYRDGVLAIGTPQMVNEPPQDPAAVSEDKRLTAEFYGGAVGLDVLAKTVDDGVFSYDIAATMGSADLAQWADDNGLAQADLHGRMDGEIRVSGLSNDIRSIRGSDGYLTISRAKLLRLPAIAQMTSVLNLRPPDNTAFRHVYLNFDVHDGLFDFKRVDLYGNNLSFVGKGRAFFRPEDYGEIDFNFGSYVPPNNTFILSRMWANIGNGWLYVKLGGTIGNPVTQIQSRVPLFDNLTAVMKSVEAGQLIAPRGRVAPGP